MREKHLEKQKQEKEKKLLEAAKASAGDDVPLISSVHAGREIADIYLKHPANESSEDEEGEEEVKEDENEEEERESIKRFLDKHKERQNKQALSAQQPSTSK